MVAHMQPILEETHECCKALGTHLLSFFTICVPFSGGNPYYMGYNLVVPSTCECRTCRED